MSSISNLSTKPMTPVQQVTLEGKIYYVYNVSLGLDNYSQRKSPYIYTKNNFRTTWASLCNVHMMGMGLIYSGIYNRFKLEIDSKYPELPRLPDKLAKYIIESSESKEYYKKRFPALFSQFDLGLKDAYGPNEIHNVLSWMTNRFIDAGVVTYFSTNTSWKDIIYDLIYNRTPVGVSGKFSGLNHIVLAVGVAYSSLQGGMVPGDNQAPDYFIIDDPFGKTYEYSKGLSGNDVWIPFDKCVSDFKSLDNANFKFSHRFIRASYLGV